MSNEHENSEDRKFTDADVQALLDAAERRFYENLGKGFWRLVWGGIMIVLIGVAAIGAYHK